MRMSVVMPSQNGTDKAEVDMEELAKLDETLQMLAQVSLSLRTARPSLRRKRSSRKASFRNKEQYDTLPSKITQHTPAPFSYTHGPVAFPCDIAQYATVVRAPRRNSAGKITKLTRHRPHLKGKPSRPGYPKDSPRSSVNHPNGGYSRGTPAVPPKQKVFTPEELANHEAQEKLRQKQMEEVLLQQTLTQQQREAAENEKWLQQEERNLNPEAPGGSRTRGSSGSNPDVPPPPSVAPSKPPRKMSKPKDEIPHGPPQTKLEEVKTAPTMQLNRDNDEVYKNTMEVVKAVLGMNSITMDAKAEDLFNSVKTVGGALKKLCACLDQVLPELPEDFHREIDMAQRTTNKDLSQVINQLKLVQRFFATTQVVEYKKCLMAANQVLAIDAKNLLDVVDRARIRKIQTAQELDKAQTEDIRHGLRDTQRAAAAHEPEDVYPSDDFL